MAYLFIPSFPFGNSQQSNLVVMIHNAFQPLSYWNGFMSPPHWEGVILDTHLYQVFSMGVRLKWVYFSPRGLHFRQYVRTIKWLMQNTSRWPAVLDRRSNLLPSGLSLANGRLRRTIAPSTSTVVESVQDMMGHFLDQPSLEVVITSLGMHLLLVQPIRLFWGNIGRRKPYRMRMVVKDGFNGRGKQRTQTSGHIKLDWHMVGFHKNLPISNSRIFVEMVHSFFFLFCMSHFLHDLTHTPNRTLRLSY
jgi:hypothetical protein